MTGKWPWSHRCVRRVDRFNLFFSKVEVTDSPFSAALIASPAVKGQFRAGRYDGAVAFDYGSVVFGVDYHA